MLDLADLLVAMSLVGLDVDQIIGGLDVSDLARIPIDPDARRSWLLQLSQFACEPDVHRQHHQVLSNILTSIEPGALDSLATDPALVALDVTPWMARGCLTLKTALLTRWASSDPMAASNALYATPHEDYSLFWRAGPDFDRDADEKIPIGPSDRWLDAIVTIAPSLIESYADAMIREGGAVNARDGRHSVAVLGKALVRWLRRNAIETPDRVWETARGRIQQATAANDIETASTIAVLDFPGDPARVRILYEAAAREISAAMKRSPGVSIAGTLSRFIRKLEVDAPELAALFSRG